MAAFLAIVDGLLMLAALLAILYLAVCATRYFAERPKPFLSSATAEDVGFVVSTHVAAGEVVTSVAHVGGGKFLVVGYRTTPKAPS